MVPRLWVPPIHWLWVRNWNFAASGAALTASRVAKRVAVSTPLRVDSLTVAVISVLLRCVLRKRAALGVAPDGCAVRRRRARARLGLSGRPTQPPRCRWPG